MTPQMFLQAFVGALALIPSVTASPNPFFNVRSPNNLAKRDLSGSGCTSFGIGNCNPPPQGCTQIGQVCVTVGSQDTTVTYPDLTGTGTFYSEVHVYLGASQPPNRAPGSFPFYATPDGSNDCSITNGGTQASCVIPNTAILGFGSLTCPDATLYIATHAATTGTNSGTGWGLGQCFDCVNNCNGNCAKYWTIPIHCSCPEVISYSSSVFSTTCITTIPITTFTVLSSVSTTTVTVPPTTTQIPTNVPTCPSVTPTVTSSTSIANPITACPAPTCVTSLVFTVASACPTS